MAEITAALVKELREQTQLPMMKCKKALVESGGDMEAAKKALREEGAKFIDGRGDRTTEEGRIALYTSDTAGAIIELQVESAPVAGNDEVVQLAKDLAEQLATGPGAATPEELWEQPCPSKSGQTLKEVRDEIVNKIREVFRVPRIHRVDGACGGYVHHDGKTGVLLEAEGGDEALAKNIGMQIVAMKPAAATKAEMDPAMVKAEEDIQKERARAEGKPEEIIEKMIVGRMKNFYAEHVLEEQPYIHDDKQTVGAVAKAGGMKIKGFTLWKVGETPTNA
ncbi:Elongation factor Ts [Posidoniimonas polymericola]|uniref:Elongation factor Ts n=1 Tax=Posidoniimonas polymericola TaxID=2528002 RepID=A0A5C5YH63_9BACT|nr:translation elongation factor Ts [Posidoniimonas polymericola]TWT74459.1 Elongation factor Ts [Posidoniimonas polymericola]